ncbi:MAG: glycosyltransferase family 39 protein [Phycisphaerae bacterium]|nr:glycosyltransferase family 39 protein [Phycisphaerae bacterium]
MTTRDPTTHVSPPSLHSAEQTEKPLSTTRAIVEPLIVLVAASVWFFWGTGVGELINTETLRAQVAREMFEGKSGWVTTIHSRTYLRKLPLHAWTTAALAHVVGRFDEQVARWPSAALGVLYVLAMYFASRGMIDPRAGPAAALLAGGNLEVLDYGLRADLDMGVLAFTTVAVLLLGWAWRAQGRTRSLALAGCYFAALLGSFWKAPHVLVTVWLTVLGLAWVDRGQGRPWKRFALHPLQWAGSLVCLACFAAWFGVLSSEVSTEKAGGFVLIEFLARVVPHSLVYIADTLLAPFQFLAIAFPACVFALMVLNRETRAALDESSSFENPRELKPSAHQEDEDAGRARPTVPEPRSRAVAHRSTLAFLLAWLVPTAIFLLIVPAKAGRYWLICLGAATLMAAMVWRGYVRRRVPAAAQQACSMAVAGLSALGILVGTGVAAFGALVLADALPSAWVPLSETASRAAGWSALTCGVLMIGAASMAVRFWRLERRSAAGVALAMVILALKPVQVFAFIPIRSEFLSVAPEARRMDDLVPPGTELYVLSDKVGSDRAGELADFGFYSRNAIRWPKSAEDGMEHCQGPVCYFLARQVARDRLEEQFGARFREVARLCGDDKRIYLVTINAE